MKYRNVLITGVNGFSGKHLYGFLAGLNEKLSITGIDISENCGFCKSYYKLDLLDKTKTRKILGRIKPDIIFHLAGIISPDYSESAKINAITTLNLLDTLKQLKLNPVIITAGSAAEYGCPLKPGKPVNENEPLKPVNPYGASKVMQTFIARQAFFRFKTKVIIARPFNILGPGLSPGLVSGRIVSQLKKIKESGKKTGVIFAGNLSPRRDFVDIRDVVRAYWKLANSKHYGETFNIGTGKSRSIKQLISLLIKYSGMKVRISVDKKSKKSADIPDIKAYTGKIRKLTGWKPRYTFEDSIKYVINQELN